jgi:TolB-like protein/Tfp pilus assembly protein PilF
MSGDASGTQHGEPRTGAPGTAQPQASETVTPAPHPPARGHHARLDFRLLAELKRRNVVRAAILYLIGCWLVLEPTHVVFHMLEVPVWANRLVLILMAIGFPAVVLFAWVYEITPEGLKPTAEVDPAQSIRKQTGQRINRAIIVVMGLGIAYLLLDKFWLAKHSTVEAPVTAAVPAPPSFNPPAHSIAVLPFVNISGDRDQEYFSDGLTEELLNSLSRISELQVAARTSAFSFKGKDAKIGTIGRELNVGAVLEGSVRRSAHTVRITAQLINALTGFHLWSQTYDRALGDVLKLQTEIATSVANALRVTLMIDAPAHIELGSTRNPQAFDAYLRGRDLFELGADERSDRAALALFEQAIAIDPLYGAAHSARSRSLAAIANEYAQGAERRGLYGAAIVAAKQAISLAPELADAHSALGFALFSGQLDVKAARVPYERSKVLGSGDADVLGRYALYCARTGRFDEARAAIARAAALDPLNPRVFRSVGAVAFAARNYAESIPAFERALARNSTIGGVWAAIGASKLLLGDIEAAKRAFVAERSGLFGLPGIAIIAKRQGNSREAQDALARLIAGYGDNSLYQQAQVYAQWNDRGRAIAALLAAHEKGDSGLIFLRNDPFLDPIRDAPEFVRLLSELGFA